MNRATTLGLSTITAVWLTLSGCTTTDAGERGHNNGVPTSDHDTSVFLKSSPMPHSKPDTLSLADTGCQSDLVETLVNRDIYERLTEGQEFDTVKNEDDPDAETTLSERVQIYRDEREKTLATFFDCRDQNAELHGLAKDIVANPDASTSPDKFKDLLVTITAERMDDIYELYPIDDFKGIAQGFKAQVMEANREVLKDVNMIIKDDVMSARVDKVVEESYDQLALNMARLEMSSYLGVEDKVEGLSLDEYVSLFQTMVTNEMRNYVTELREVLKTAGPSVEI